MNWKTQLLERAMALIESLEDIDDDPQFEFEGHFYAVRVVDNDKERTFDVHPLKPNLDTTVCSWMLND